jgi:hypothetical protein
MLPSCLQASRQPTSFSGFSSSNPATSRFDTSYPDLSSSRDEDFVLIEILWSVGRSVKVRRKLLGELMERLAAEGLTPDNVMVVFRETSSENWSFGGGRLLHV